MKKKKVIILIVTLLLVVGLGALLFIISSRKSDTVELIYGASTYNLEMYKDKIKVKALEEVQCIQAPCSKIERKYVLRFSKDNIEIIEDFVYYLADYYKLVIYEEKLTEEQMNIVDAIIQNDESLIVKGGK